MSEIYENRIDKILAAMSIEEKLHLLYGSDKWHIHAIEKEGLKEIAVSDGPHGLRKENDNAKGLEMPSSVPAVCYPTASALACSFDTELLYKIGTALAEECRKEKISVLLGPGVNHKRSPLCGRNFEYFSEDPVLSSRLASSMIDGLQNNGIGACLKHFAVNSQEYGRLINDSVIDKRALMELYLSQFEYIIKKSQPWAVMPAYNKINGTYCCENKWLLTDTARKSWGFKGAFISDWGAVSNLVKSFKNGLNIEMPGGNNGSFEVLKKAYEECRLKEFEIDNACRPVIELLLKGQPHEEQKGYDVAAHLSIAQEAAEKSGVLLKNEECTLPLKKDDSIALIGALAKEPRYQGDGSSRVNSITLDSIHEAMRMNGLDFDYADGYDINNNKPDKFMISEACKLAKKKDKAIIVVGLPASYESEGFDRDTMTIPDCMVELIKKVSKVNPDTIVILQCGSPVHMPWISRAKAVLLMYLSGCQGGNATVNLLTGKVNPSGKLAETFPLRMRENPSYNYFANDPFITEYRESIFSGYRYYDTATKDVLFPFGHGLSYTTFSYTDLSVEKLSATNNFKVSFRIKNTGKMDGYESYQLYIGQSNSKIVRPKKELKHFGKIFIPAGKSTDITVNIDENDFRYFDTQKDTWAIEDGKYCIYIGSSSVDIRLSYFIRVSGIDDPHSDICKWYYKVEDCMVSVEKATFEKALGHSVPEPRKLLPFTADTSFLELSKIPVGKLIYEAQKIRIKKSGNDMIANSFSLLPLRTLNSVNISKLDIEKIIHILNKTPFSGIHKIIDIINNKSRK